MKYEMRHITDMLGIKRPALRQWIDLGFVRPSEKAEGHGTRNLWTRADVFDLAVFKKLLDHGFTREEASQVLRERSVLIVRGRECRPADRMDFQTEDVLGYDTSVARIVDLEGVSHTLVVTRVDTHLFAALDSAAKHVGLLYGVASVKIVSITDAMRQVAALL